MTTRRPRRRKPLVLPPPTPEQRAFGATVRQCRRLLSWSQQRLATELGYEDKAMISLIEHGLRTPSLWRALRLAHLCQRPLVILAGRDPGAVPAT